MTVKRVEMRSPASSGTALVPEAQVERYVSRGWSQVEAKPAPAKKAPAKKAAAKSDDD